MYEPRRLWVFKSCYRDSFTVFLTSLPMLKQRPQYILMLMQNTTHRLTKQNDKCTNRNMRFYKLLIVECIGMISWSVNKITRTNVSGVLLIEREHSPGKYRGGSSCGICPFHRCVSCCWWRDNDLNMFNVEVYWMTKNIQWIPTCTIATKCLQ
jgi:hypothetical protein